MDTVWIILAVASFFGGQLLLFFCMRRLDRPARRTSDRKEELTYDDRCRYPEEIVVE